MRVKAYGRFGDQESNSEKLLESFGYLIDNIRDRKLPLISEYPEDFLLYVYRNFIRMPSVDTKEYDGRRRFKDLRCVEMCLHGVVLRQIFKLRLEDYLEVEPKWHCVTSTEVSI